MKQSLQCHLAQIRAPEAFGGALRLLGSGDLVLVASEQEAGRLDAGEAASVPHRVAVWVGPEGGFADREMECLAQGGGRCFSLGPTRLRSETAAVAAVALVTQRFCWP
jgi:16S rRNA (uracil1498-N3)-methyltransferase